MYMNPFTYSLIKNPVKVDNNPDLCRYSNFSSLMQTHTHTHRCFSTQFLVNVFVFVCQCVL